MDKAPKVSDKIHYYNTPLDELVWDTVSEIRTDSKGTRVSFGEFKNVPIDLLGETEQEAIELATVNARKRAKHWDDVSCRLMKHTEKLGEQAGKKE